MLLLLSCAASAGWEGRLVIDCHKFGVNNTGTKDLVVIEFFENAKYNNPGRSVGGTYLNYRSWIHTARYRWEPQGNKDFSNMSGPIFAGSKDNSNVGCSMPMDPNIGFQPYLTYDLDDFNFGMRPGCRTSSGNAYRCYEMTIKIYMPVEGPTIGRVGVGVDPDTGYCCTSSRDVKEIALSPGPADAMWIDAVGLFPGGGSFVSEAITFGKDGGRGYCISRDPNDSFGSDNHRTPCSPCWEFNLETGQASQCDAMYPLRSPGFAEHGWDRTCGMIGGWPGCEH